MKIAILSHFGSFQDGYALHIGWLERAKMLERFKQDFDFLVNVNCPKDLYPNQINNLTTIPRGAPFEEQANHYATLYLSILKDYDIILTADLIYQRTFLAYNAAMRLAEPSLKAFWLHWVHSAWTHSLPNTPYPQNLRHTMMEHSWLVYMNKRDAQGLAQMYNTSPENVKCVYNPKDYRSFHNLDPLTCQIIDLLDIPNKGVIQIFPHCATRMEAKGIDPLIMTFAALKRKGQKVALIFANANARHRLKEIEEKKEYCKSMGLIDGEDFIFTNELTHNKPLPRRNVAELFRLANLFVFASRSEVSPNCLIEAKISDNLLVVSNRLKCLREFAGVRALYFDASFRTPGITDGAAGDLQLVTYHDPNAYFDDLAMKILNYLPMRYHLWDFSYENIWYKQMKPLLEDATKQVKNNWEKKAETITISAFKRKEITVGLMAISDFPLAATALSDLLRYCDQVVLRFDNIKGDAELFSRCLLQIPTSYPHTIINATSEWNRWNWREELIRELDTIKPTYVLFLDQDEKYDENFEEDFEEFKKSDAQIMMFDYKMVTASKREVPKYPKARHMKAFKWSVGVNYIPYKGYAIANFPGIYPEPDYRTNRFIAISCILHYCFFTQEMEETKVLHK